MTIDPNTEAQSDRAAAERLRWEERQENDPNIRKGLEQAAQGYDSEASAIENAGVDEVGDEENPE